MIRATREMVLPATITGSLPRPVWYTENLAMRPLQYSSLWKVAQGMTTRPVKFGTITPELIGASVGNDYYADQQSLIRDLSDAMREELLELARAGCPIVQMEEPNIHLVSIQRGGGP